MSWLFRYKVRRIGSQAAVIFDHKRRAFRFARMQTHGDWVVVREWFTGHEQTVAVFGGYFDDWPIDLEDER